MKKELVRLLKGCAICIPKMIDGGLIAWAEVMNEYDEGIANKRKVNEGKASLYFSNFGEEPIKPKLRKYFKHQFLESFEIVSPMNDPLFFTGGGKYVKNNVLFL